MATSDFPALAGVGTRLQALSRTRLSDILIDTLKDLETLALKLDTQTRTEALRTRTRAIHQIRDHILPRLQNPDVPAVVVVGGSTGAGKSTLVNSILGMQVTEAGILRPTTRTPVLIVNPKDAQAFATHPITAVVRTVNCAAVPEGLAIVDACDLDSVKAANRLLATRLFEIADLWLFVTTAARYGDRVPWDNLLEATARAAAVAVVLNRVPPAVLNEVRNDLLTRLEDLKLTNSPFFVVRDAGPQEGILPDPYVNELREWLDALAGRHRAAGLMRRTDQHLWTGLRKDLLALAEAIDMQADAAQKLENSTEHLREAARAKIKAFLPHLAAGAPTTRWVTLASAGAPLADLAQGATLRSGWLKRKEKARAKGLTQLVDDICAQLITQLDSTTAELLERVSRVWTQAGVKSEATTCLGQNVSASDSIETWRQLALKRVQALAPGSKGLDSQALANLVLAATALPGALKAAQKMGLTQLVEQTQASLYKQLNKTIEAAVPPQAALNLAADLNLGAALRLRAGELQPLVSPGEQ